MAFERSPVVVYALDNGFVPEAGDLAVVTAEREARAARADQIANQLMAGTYEYPDTFSPTFKRTAVAATAAIMMVGSLAGIYKLATYEPVRPVQGPYCPADAYGQNPPVTFAMDKSEAYTHHTKPSDQALKIIIGTC